MSDPIEARRQQLTLALCRYLVDHPSARDTLEGIRHWWLSHESSGSQEVERLLRDLTERQWLLNWHVASGAEVYGLNPQALPDIQRFLDGSRDAKEERR